jgi:pimeloyl-ACP methyl ester carboxylesterase
MVTLIARLDVEALSWVGTSMGGLIGMALAAQPGSPVKRLVLNDAGPVVSKVSLERIGSYLGRAPAFASLEEAEVYVRAVAAPFGRHSDAEWRFLTEIWLRKGDDGAYRAHYDPRIAEPFRASMPEKDMELWPLYDAIRCPTLVIRGAESDLLSKKTSQEMARRGPKARVVEIPEVGHAPTLMHSDQNSFLMEHRHESGRGFSRHPVPGHCNGAVDPRFGAREGLPELRHQHRPGRLLAAGLEGRVARHRHRSLPRRRGGGVRRRRQGAL